jgi:hypothetical protein
MARGYGKSNTDCGFGFFEIAVGVFGEQHFEAHQPRALFSLSRLIAVPAGTTLPCSIWRLPKARIFSSAIVSWVCSYIKGNRSLCYEIWYTLPTEGGTISFRENSSLSRSRYRRVSAE